MGILGPHDDAVFRDKAARELMVAVFALIGQAFLEPSSEVFPLPTLRLGKALFCLAEFVWMRNLLASRERQERGESRVYTNGAIADRRNGVGLRINDQAEIPA
jgi:hypothetical protein